MVLRVGFGVRWTADEKLGVKKGNHALFLREMGIS